MSVHRVALVAALVTLAFHLAANPHYGFYRDELYFIVCGFHPAFGYVDQPPLVPLLAAGSQFFGHSLFALRAVTALLAAGGVYLTCLLVEELEGGSFAQALGALVVAVTPILASFGMRLSTDGAGLVLWPLLALCAAKLLRGGDRRWWLAAGAAAGLGFEAKYSIAVYAAAMLAGVALAGRARVFADRWCVGGAALAVAIGAPSVIWQAAHGFPLFELLHAQQQTADVVHSPVGYVLQQAIVTNPLLAPFWIFGVAYAFAKPPLRWIGWTCVLTIGAFAFAHGKNYYSGNLYPLPIAAAAVGIERLVRQPLQRSVIVALCTLVSLATMPFVFPILHESQLASVVAVGKRFVKVEIAPERNADAAITQGFADMHGWENIAPVVAQVYRSLPPERRARAAILASNWGEAAALDYYGPAYGLPPAISGHNNYYVWGPRGYDGSTVIEVNGTCAEPGLFAIRHPGVAFVHSEWAMPAESDIPISICEDARETLAAYWPRLKLFL